jgi:hypothetical protein
MSATVERRNSRDDASVPSVAPSESAPVRILSTVDSTIADLIKEQPTLEQLASIKVVDRGRIPDILALPDEVLPLHGKKYRYGWLDKGNDLTAAVQARGWVLCNRSNSPHLKSYRFGGHGGVEQGGMLLAFMPEDRYVEIFERGPSERSRARVKMFTKDIYKNVDKDAPVSFYKPEDKDE